MRYYLLLQNQNLYVLRHLHLGGKNTLVVFRVDVFTTIVEIIQELLSEVENINDLKIKQSGIKQGEIKKVLEHKHIHIYLPNSTYLSMPPVCWLAGRRLSP